MATGQWREARGGIGGKAAYHRPQSGRRSGRPASRRMMPNANPGNAGREGGPARGLNDACSWTDAQEGLHLAVFWADQGPAWVDSARIRHATTRPVSTALPGLESVMKAGVRGSRGHEAERAARRLGAVSVDPGGVLFAGGILSDMNPGSTGRKVGLLAARTGSLQTRIPCQNRAWISAWHCPRRLRGYRRSALGADAHSTLRRITPVAICQVGREERRRASCAAACAARNAGRPKRRCPCRPRWLPSPP
jgi:hypothetical protein